jgi:hypothetical protein
MSVVAGARALFAQLASEHAVKVAAEAGELAAIHELCLLHNAVDEDAFGEAAENLIHHGADGTPAVAEYLALEVGALLGIADSSAAALLGRVLNCALRHPLLWEAVQTEAVEWHRAREVVDEVTGSGLSAEAAQWVDQRITPLLMTLPRHRLRRKLLGLVALADPALARQRELKARINRPVTFWAPTILADPEQALNLLNGGAPTSKRRAMTVILHLSDASLADPESVARVDGRNPLPRETWTELLGHDHITIRLVVDPAMAPVDAYEIPDTIRDAVCFRSPSSVFPYGSQPSRSLDLDHTIPYDHSRGRPRGQTRVGNLGPLTRRAHRAKTARRWQVTQTEDGWFEWVSPAGYRYAVGPYGTPRQARSLPATAA